MNWKSRLGVCGLLAGAALLAYSNSFTTPFQFDDYNSILNEPLVSGPASAWEKSRGALTAARPLPLLSFIFNFTLGGLDPRGYHVFNWLVHVLAGLTLFALARCAFGARLCAASPPERRRAPAADPTAPALALALLWLLHPLQTQSVTYLTQRHESLLGLFLLLSLYAFARAFTSPRALPWLAAALLAAALSLACKPVAVVLPLLWLLYDRTFLSGSFTAAWRRSRFLYVGLGIMTLAAAVWLYARSAGNSAGFGLTALRPWTYLAGQAGALLHYVRLAFWPAGLCLDYYDWPAASWENWPAGLVVLSLLGATVWALRRAPALGFAAASFFILLAPTSSFMPILDQVAEHRLYLPLAGLIALPVAGAPELWARWNGRGAAERRWNAGLTAVTACLALCLGLLTYGRNHDYRSETALWRSVLTVRPGNARAHGNLARSLAEEGRQEEAVRHYREALRLNPNYAEAHKNLAHSLERLVLLEEAAGHARRALQLFPDYAEAHRNLGTVLFRLGRLLEAKTHFEEAVRLQPADPHNQSNLGAWLASQGRPAEALPYLQAALRLNPRHAEAHNNLANAHLLLGREEEALAEAEAALRLKPEYGEARATAGEALLRLRRPREALAHLEADARLRPENPRTRELLELARRAETAAPPQR